jgi:hypothetical protein
MSVYVDTAKDKAARSDGSASVRWGVKCFFGTHAQCRGRVWREGAKTPCECGCHGDLANLSAQERDR